MLQKSICETLIQIEREKEESKQYCVCVGAPFDGQEMHGPFPSFDAASDWADRQNSYTWILTLHRPE